MRVQRKLVVGTAVVVCLGVLSSAVGASALDANSRGLALSSDEDMPTLGCVELAAADAINVEMERVFDPTTGQLKIMGKGGTYEFNVADVTCRKFPSIATLVDDVLQVYRENQAQECAGIKEELAAIDPALLAKDNATLESPKGEMNLAALVRYGEEVCGGSVPGSARP